MCPLDPLWLHLRQLHLLDISACFHSLLHLQLASLWLAVLLQVLNAWLGLADTLLVAYLVNVFVVAGYLHYVINVVNEICAFLDIPCLTIRRKQDIKQE